MVIRELYFKQRFPVMPIVDGVSVEKYVRCLAEANCYVVMDW